MSYQAPLSNVIVYKLEGYDKEWYTLEGGNSKISYSNLPYGSYTLRVKGANSDGIWSLQERILKIKVNPPFIFPGQLILFTAFCQSYLS